MIKERTIYLTYNLRFTIYLMIKYRNILSYFYVMSSAQIVFVVVFVNQTGTEIFLYF